jgi:hypothetical protein
VAGPTLTPSLFEPGRSDYINLSLTGIFHLLNQSAGSGLYHSFRGKEIDVLVQPEDEKFGDETGPHTDEEAIDLLYGHLNSGSFVGEYERLRDSGMNVEQALIFTGHEFRLRQLEFRAAR